jgi:drug/metabolite transporter (DMT)-like permease
VSQEAARSHAAGWATALLALAGCLWGTGFFFGKIAFREMTVAENVFFRFFFACLILVPILIGKWKTFAGADLWWLIAATVVGVPVQFLMQFKGLQLTTVSHAALIVGTLPVLLALSSTFFLRERLSKFGMDSTAFVPGGRTGDCALCRAVHTGCRADGSG